jgi:hypothetical protein
VLEELLAMKKLIYYAVLLAFLPFPHSYANEGMQLIKSFQDWQVTTSPQGCFAISEPKRTRAFYGLRNKPFFAVKYISNNTFTISTSPGFQVAKNKETIININNRSYSLYTGDGNFIWPASESADAFLINALLTSGGYFRVNSYNYQENNAMDYYSTKGLYRALQYMNDHCK